ncbi:hypothetical protein JQ634_15290 [Bradyrhizobium sp. AUGA SZCCT0240]|uniref:hypothetical protein n=1 Tax=Bradyrhizobium sp. AUGA SZCCT0240 TaxID=2807669 RepID=UPI001BA89664|nr:hypothetical protein [Bradyrhizobium sp. AUGA SZCCT0240]MBR1255061.1 hypothetical protein [Bradyrhizobium sp. AUGA SZCCT0240]
MADDPHLGKRRDHLNARLAVAQMLGTRSVTERLHRLLIFCCGYMASAKAKRQTALKKNRRRIGRGHQGMVDAISANRMEPAIEKIFALALMERGAHFGKVAIAIG